MTPPLQRLKDAILAEDATIKFDMSTWRAGLYQNPHGAILNLHEYADMDTQIKGMNRCGTVCCMGGMVEVLRIQSGETLEDENGSRIRASADWLGLPYKVAHALFHPVELRRGVWAHITAEQAVGAIDVAMTLDPETDTDDQAEVIHNYWASLRSAFHGLPPSEF